MKKITSLCLALLLCLCLVPAMADYSDAVYGTVRVLTEYTPSVTSGAYGNGTSFVVLEDVSITVGSAFAVGCDDEEVRYFVTNAHNLESSEEFPVVIIDDAIYAATGSLTLATVDEKYIELPAEPTLYIIFDTIDTRAKTDVLKISDRTDLAVVELQVPSNLRKPMTLRPFEPDDLVETKANVYSVGFPFAATTLLDEEHLSMLESDPKACVVRAGISSNVLGHNQTQKGEVVGHDAVINGGNSGGPLVDQDGNVIGVNTWGIAGEEGLYYSVSVNEVIRLLDDLDIEYRTVNTFPMALVIGAGVAVLIVLALVLLLRNRKTGYLLVGVAGALRGKAYPLYKKTLVGRTGSAQICFPDNADGVSGKHCIIDVKGKTITVTDTSSRGTWIDNVKLNPGVATPITQGQTIFFGSAKHGMMVK